MGGVEEIWRVVCHSSPYVGEEERPDRGDHSENRSNVSHFHQVVIAGTTAANAPFVLTQDVNPVRPPVGLVPLGEEGYHGQVDVLK